MPATLCVYLCKDRMILSQFTTEKTNQNSIIVMSFQMLLTTMLEGLLHIMKGGGAHGLL